MAALADRLGQFAEKYNPHRKTVFTLLDKVREQILARRDHSVSYYVLAREAKLRKYIRAQTGAKKQRNKAVPKIGNSDGKPVAPATSAESKPAGPARYQFNLNT